MVCLAYESGVDDDIPSAMALLGLCPSHFFRSDTHEEQLRDPMYREVATWLGKKLVSQGHLELGGLLMSRVTH
jgi:hypothetical protein